MNWKVFDLQTLLILAWITVGKFFTVPLVAIIARSAGRPLFGGEIRHVQTQREFASIWLLLTDAVVLALLLAAGGLRLQTPTPTNSIITLVLMVLWGECWMYWTHRWMHHNKVLWAWHRHHHLSRPPQALSSISFSIGEKLIFYTLGWLLFISIASWAVPVSLWGIAGYYTFYFFASPIAHSNSGAFGFFSEHAPQAVRKIMGTAETHGRHHVHLTCNYGFMTVALDRLFGTFQDSKEKRTNVHQANYKNFGEFYSFYLEQHRHPVCRILHVAGVLASVALLITILVRHWWTAVPLFPLPGYVLGWIGHFYFEKNRPASFKYPFYSFAGDIRMAIDVLAGREPLWQASGMATKRAQS
jgi:hypothetical protein